MRKLRERWKEIASEGACAFTEGGADLFMKTVDPNEYVEILNALEETAPDEWGFGDTFEECEVAGEHCKIMAQQTGNGWEWVLGYVTQCHMCPHEKCEWRGYETLINLVWERASLFVMRERSYDEDDMLYLLHAELIEPLADEAVTLLEYGDLYAARHKIHLITIIEKKWGKPTWQPVLDEFPPVPSFPGGCAYCGSTLDLQEVCIAPEVYWEVCPRCGAPA